jgi:hypothetical protein
LAKDGNAGAVLKLLYEIVPAFRPLSATANQIIASESSVDTMGGMPRAV